METRCGCSLASRFLSAARQKRRCADHTDRHEGNDPHGPNWRPIVANCPMKSKISRHDLLQMLPESGI
jgi:hypothetical protein